MERETGRIATAAIAPAGGLVHTVSHSVPKFNSFLVLCQVSRGNTEKINMSVRLPVGAACGGFVALVLSLIGCSSEGPSKGAPTYPVEGVVKLKGQPVVGADIVFSQKDGSSSSFGRTDASGHYQLTTRKSNDGAPPGDYLVSI